MHDLRKQVLLESGKTLSKKAKAKQAMGSAASSKQNSPNASRAGSRVASRQASDDEADFSDSTTQFSVNSFDELRPEDIDAPEDAWVAQLNERMEHLIERKRSSVQGREESLSVLSHLLMAHYAQRHVRPKLSELVPALLKCAKGGQSDNETALALKALSLLIITEPSGSIYDAMIRPLKGIISSSESSSVMVAAIHTLGIATFYGGVGLDETQEIMDFYLEIIESDGHSVEAADDGNVVAAALQEWGFLATQFEGMEDTSEEPMEAFVEQLESSDASVVIAAGENIALLFEKSWSELEEDEEPERKAEEDDEEESDPTAKGMVKRYTVWRQEHQLKHTLSALAQAHGKRISRKDKKELHSSFADILSTVEHPTRGPRYSNAIDQYTNKAYGSRMVVNIGKNSMSIDKWWKLHRLQSLRRALQGGFIVHYEDNQVVFDSLPVELD
ncbi:IFRD domain protein [Aureobasidium sp. EXF-12298]|nr:IFRD domain protein [Aureobasidium sp. EXF-12298]KAI4761608.1 IFRD domain protein [Aureobasidium sp. EXF-12344]KAI4778904.1 IFRD domain protein [Aureobasidium sp. EXF-3400]